jgi:hypothetical protein
MLVTLSSPSVAAGARTEARADGPAPIGRNAVGRSSVGSGLDPDPYPLVTG